MKQRRKLFRDLVNQLLILLVLGVGLYLLFRERAALDNLGRLSLIRYALYGALLIYLILLSDTLRVFGSKYFFKRYDPTDPASLEELSKVQRYHIYEPGRSRLTGEELILRYMREFERTGFKELTRQSFGIVFEKAGSLKTAERCIFIYKPMLNVLIADRHLKDATEFILRAKRKIRHNSLVMITDMDSASEILSSAVSVVNFVPKLTDSLIFVPYVLDVLHGKLFYPQDKSGQGLFDRRHYAEERKKITRVSLGGSAPRRPSAK